MPRVIQSLHYPYSIWTFRMTPVD